MTDPSGFDQAEQVMYDAWDDTAGLAANLIAMLFALLAARMETPCPECGGWGYSTRGLMSDPDQEPIACPNRDCHEGMVATDTPLIVMGSELLGSEFMKTPTLFRLAPSAAARLTKEPE
jgi:hypothetical protein